MLLYIKRFTPPIICSSVSLQTPYCRCKSALGMCKLSIALKKPRHTYFQDRQTPVTHRSNKRLIKTSND